MRPVLDEGLRHCVMGIRSAQAGQKLLDAGFATVYNLRGGIQAWKEAGYTTEQAPRTPASPSSWVSLQRQVQSSAGSGVLLGMLLGALVSAWCVILSGARGVDASMQAAVAAVRGLCCWHGCRVTARRKGDRGAVNQTKRRSLTLVVLVVVAYILMRKFAALFGEPALALPPPQEREPFRADFVLPDMQGRLTQLADFRGRPIVLNFWATWCAPCRAEMPSMQALYNDYHPKGLTLVAIATDGAGAAVVAPFLQAYQVTFPVLLDPQGVVGRQLQLPAIPTTYVLDKHGRIASFVLGARDWNAQTMRQLFDQLLAEDDTRTAP